MSRRPLNVRGRGPAQNLLRFLALFSLALPCGSGSGLQDSNPPKAQTPIPPTAQASSRTSSQTSNTAEIQSHESIPPFRIRAERNLVTVRVVVRDAKGQAVGRLRKEDFRLFDEGKPQEITGFTVEPAQPATTAEARAAPTSGPGRAIEAQPPTATAPQRFVALYFDDFHMEGEGIGRTRNAAWQYVTTAVRPEDRLAILTATGRDTLDFTDDREKLHETLFHLAPRPHPSTGCPEIDEYEAYLVDKMHAPDALGVLHADAIRCYCGFTDTNTYEGPATVLLPSTGRGAPPDPCPAEAMRMAEAQAADVWSHVELESLHSLQGMDIGVRRLAAMPGQRTLVLVSPGFLTLTQGDKIDAIINRALHEGVVISALDAAGLYARNPHAITNAGRPDLEAQKTILSNMGTVASEDVMANLSAGTGGVFFHDSNDFDDGFRQTAALPETYYVLSFSPTNFKPDGKFHLLKVTLNTHGLFTVESRRGYFASQTSLASSQTEVEKLVFSQEEVHGLPAEVTTQVEKLDGQKSRLTVVIHVDLRSLQFHKESDRSVNTLIFDTAIFDSNGNYVALKEESLELRLKDATLEKLAQSGIYAKTNFDVAPATYRVREVVRDAESKGMSALSSNVQVPAP